MIGEVHVVTPEQLMAYRDGELPERSAESVGAHLHGCRQCQELGGELGDVSQILASWKVCPAAADPDLERRLSERAAVCSARRPFRTRVAALGGRHRFSFVAGAAALIAVALVMASISNRRPSSALVAQVSGRIRSASGDATRELRSEARDAARTQSPLQQAPGQQISSSFENQSITALPSPQPLIAQTVSLSVVVKDFAASRTILDAIVRRHHGYAATLNASTQPNAARSLQASLRIPAGELRAAVAELKSLGYVESEAQAGEEVTQQHADLAARLKNSRQTEQRLEAILMQRTGKIGDVLDVEREITRVRGEIEQMEAEQKQLEHRVDFATIDLNLAEQYRAQIGSPSPSMATRFHNALVGGYRSAVESVVGILVFFAEYGPSAIIWLAFLSPLAWFLRRQWIRAASVTL
jgi:hypothetical protein